MVYMIYLSYSSDLFFRFRSENNNRNSRKGVEIPFVMRTENHAINVVAGEIQYERREATSAAIVRVYIVRAKRRRRV